MGIRGGVCIRSVDASGWEEGDGRGDLVEVSSGRAGLLLTEGRDRKRRATGCRDRAWAGPDGARRARGQVMGAGGGGWRWRRVAVVACGGERASVVGGGGVRWWRVAEAEGERGHRDAELRETRATTLLHIREVDEECVQPHALWHMAHRSAV